MARRKRSSSIDSLFRDTLFVGVFVVAVALLVLPLIWKVIFVTLFLIGIAIYLFRYRQQLLRLRATGIDDIDLMDGKAFEERLWLLFKDLGYTVQATQYRGDWGAD